MKDEDLHSNLCMALMRVGAAVTGGFDRFFAVHRLTHAQFRTLLAVYEAGSEGVAPSVLAEQLFLERTTVTAVTTRLVDRGWLERAPGENRRTVRLRLTRKGLEVLRELVPLASVLAAQTLEPLSTPALQVLQGALNAAEEALRHTLPRARGAGLRAPGEE
ncbi:MarR family winged helix-turn-helix transcriptional regulator [Deinococcus hopiensis]|uniref:DNA-binding transcriptional regulator, MarR family n=1 Tax=Deinococcus hopiensis KR-140 TaxID=695939 RepID=A0A1W1VEW9_9DEIO|nr:MarR family transcriptional regulator [Deinococcus hopiensis]SMB91908.1 DNA-binding transcriptional regulator, MarR family [Deinococcus hopiensis KR-140]